MKQQNKDKEIIKLIANGLILIDRENKVIEGNYGYYRDNAERLLQQVKEDCFDDFLGTLDDDSCECDNCCRTRRYFENPKKEVLRYKNKLNAEIKKAREEERREVIKEIENSEVLKDSLVANFIVSEILTK